MIYQHLFFAWEAISKMALTLYPTQNSVGDIEPTVTQKLVQENSVQEQRPTPEEFVKYRWAPRRVKGDTSVNLSSKKNLYPAEAGEINYGIVMDAGSTGTRIFIYEWNTPSSCHNSPYIRPSYHTSGPHAGKQFKIKRDGGLADIEPELVPEYLEAFILNATQFIPRHKHSATPIFLKATAGMRLLPQHRAQAILGKVREVFQDTPFRYDPKFGVQIIPGEYEGVFGWLTVNYLAGVLGSKDMPSIGMMDMGGASCQITFETPHVPLENAFPINLNGTSRVVYTHSYLRFGRNEARSRYHSSHFEVQVQNQDELPLDPCFIKGYQGVSDGGVEFVGSGDFQACLENTEKLTLKDPFCPTSSCAVNGVYQPELPENMNIYGIAGMFKVAKWFKCKGKSSLQCLVDSASKICSNLNSDQYRGHFRKKTDDKDFDNYCFMAAYIVNMLKTGYGMTMDREIHFSSEIYGADVGWTLGAMIYEVNLIYPSGQCCS